MGDLRSKFRKRSISHGPVEPIELFESLPIRGSDIKDLWRPQADALREWHKIRNKNDIVFMLNTGAGKTLLGLLVGLSLANETCGKILYVCGTNQLIEQTKIKAHEYGIPLTTYYNQQWSDVENYERGLGPCLTNYQAVFNGKSIFNREEINAVIFDDAHTAHSIIQEQYTLKITKSTFPNAWDEMVFLIREYFYVVHRKQRFTDIVEGVDSSSVIFVPTFVSGPLANEFSQIMIRNKVHEKRETKFVWDHLKDKLAYCAVFIDSFSISFVPALPPTHEHPMFTNEVRRIYLSATITTELDFSRTFSRLPEAVIKPGGRAGDCERMILCVPSTLNDNEGREWAKQGTKNKKVLVMVPNRASSKEWKDFGDIFESTEGNLRLRQFASSVNEKLILIARYDGIDLPGDDCRILIIDGLPSGTSHMERFFETHIGVKGLMDAVVASRLTQVFGRISRGMSDYGAVLIVGRQLLKWINDPRHRALLPKHIIKQLEIGDSLSDNSDDFSLEELIDKCLNRSEDWLEIYEENLIDKGKSISTKELKDVESYDEAELIQVAKCERSFIKYLWNDEPEKAITELLKLTKSDKVEESLKAWYFHWLGYCYSICKNQDSNTSYLRASRMRAELGRPIKVDLDEFNLSRESSIEAETIAERLKLNEPRLIAIFDNIIGDLSIEKSSNQVENALKELGYWLGFESCRPDKDLKIGPDILWVDKNRQFAYIIEAKTGKIATSNYTKDEMGQYHQHIQWFKDNYTDIKTEYRFIVGPICVCSKSASPPNDLWVITLEEFNRIARLLKDRYIQILSAGFDMFYTSRIQDVIEKERLNAIFSSIEKVLITSIQEI